MTFNQQILIIRICCQTVYSVCMSELLLFSLFWFKIVGLTQVSPLVLFNFLSQSGQKESRFCPLCLITHWKAAATLTAPVSTGNSLLIWPPWKNCLSEEIRGYSICFLCWLTDISALIWTRSEVSFLDTCTFMHTESWDNKKLSISATSVITFKERQREREPWLKGVTEERKRETERLKHKKKDAISKKIDSNNFSQQENYFCQENINPVDIIGVISAVKCSGCIKALVTTDKWGELWEM